MTQEILSTKKLSIILGVPRDVLIDVAANKQNYYKPFIKKEIKRDGTIKERKIDNPNKPIRQIQRKINKKLLQPLCIELPSNMVGSIPGKSIKDNATPHQRQECLLAVDISNCFPSIHANQIYKVYRERLFCSPPVAQILTKLTTYGDRIPQGSPASPSLCNLVLAPMVEELLYISESNNLNFTQYVDDLTFSGARADINRARHLVLRTVESYGFVVNAKKLKLSNENERMEVTGLVVNSKISVGRKYIREVEREIMHASPKTKLKIKGKISYVGSVSKRKAEKLNKKLSKKLS